MRMVWLALAGCNGGKEPPGAETEGPTGTGTIPWWAFDADGDGWTPVDGDCDDADADVHPAAADLEGDGVDGDCDGTDRAARRPEVAWSTDEPPGQQVGYALAFGADLDHDGLAELTVAAPSLFADLYGVRTRGMVRQFGSVEALAAGAPAVTWSGTDTDDALGFVVAAGGDTDGDGFGELLVGSAVGTGDRRSVFLLRDAAEPLAAAARLEGPDGWALHGVGFGDGDVLVLTAGGDDDLVSRLVRVARPEGAVALADAGEALQFALDVRVRTFAAGDLDGDGLADVVAGAPEAFDGAGAVFGCAGADLVGTVDGEAACAARWDGEAAADGAGGAVAVGGDLDGDGRADVLVGAPGFGAAEGPARAGRAYLLTEPLAGGVHRVDAAYAHLTGEVAEDRAGGALHGPGDVDGDGQDDVLLAAPADPGARYSPGRVYLFTGPVPAGALDPGSAAAVFAGTAPHGAFGAAMASGDLDGDGAVELVFGAPFAELGDGVVHALGDL